MLLQATLQRKANLPMINVVGLSRNIDEQLKHVHKVIEFAEGAKRQKCVTLLRYKEDKPKSSYAQTQLFTHRTEEEIVQQLFYVNNEFGKFSYLLDVMKSVSDKVPNFEHLCNTASYFYATFVFGINLERMSWNNGENRNLILRSITQIALSYCPSNTKIVSHRNYSKFT